MCTDDCVCSAQFEFLKYDINVCRGGHYNYHNLLHCNGCSLKIKLNLSVTILGGDNLFKYTNFRPMVVESLKGWTKSAIHEIIATYYTNI